MKTEEQQRMYRALLSIAKDFDSSTNVMKHADRDYGLEPIEALEMAYDNMQDVAQRAIKGLRCPEAPDKRLSNAIVDTQEEPK